jgi:hypothetical protein
MLKLKISFFNTEFVGGTGRALSVYKTFIVSYKTENVRRALGFAARKMHNLKRKDNSLYNKNTRTEFVK